MFRHDEVARGVEAGELFVVPDESDGENRRRPVSEDEDAGIGAPPLEHLDGSEMDDFSNGGGSRKQAAQTIPRLVRHELVGNDVANAATGRKQGKRAFDEKGVFVERFRLCRLVAGLI